MRARLTATWRRLVTRLLRAELDAMFALGYEEGYDEGTSDGFVAGRTLGQLEGEAILLKYFAAHDATAPPRLH